MPIPFQITVTYTLPWTLTQFPIFCITVIDEQCFSIIEQRIPNKWSSVSSNIPRDADSRHDSVRFARFHRGQCGQWWSSSVTHRGGIQRSQPGVCGVFRQYVSGDIFTTDR